LFSEGKEIMLVQIALVSCGAALGGLARWGLNVLAGRFLGPAFPWGTLFINVSGSLFLGWFMTLLSFHLVLQQLGWFRAEDLRLLVAVGFTGAYTTFSTFTYESHRMLDEGNTFAALIYLLGSVFLGLMAVRCGVLLANW